MFAACIDIQVTENLVTQAVLREHAADGVLDYCSRLAGEQFLGGGETLAARITGMANVHAVRKLLARKTNLVRIDDDDVVTTVNMRRIARLVLATEDKSDTGSQATQDLIRRIDNQPLFGDGTGVSRDGLVAKCVHCVDF